MLVPESQSGRLDLAGTSEKPPIPTCTGEVVSDNPGQAARMIYEFRRRGGSSVARRLSRDGQDCDLMRTGGP
jgi:hypothetical protein